MIKMKFFRSTLAVLFILMLSSSLALAHHSSAATFTKDKSTTIEGVITDFRFRNPHVIIYIDVADDGGTVTNWMVEGSAATGWRREGWKNDSLKKGDLLRVSGDATIDGSPMVWLGKMQYLDKQTKAVIAELNPRENPDVSFARIVAPAPAISAEILKMPLTLPGGIPNFTGVTRQENSLMPPTRGGPDGNDAAMPYNEVGKVALAEWKIENDPQVFCDPPGVVRQAGYTPYGYKLMQYDDHVTFEYEEYGSRRAIFFGDKLPKPGVRSHLGDSVARYEGNALIIDTVNLLPNASGHRGKPLSDQHRVTEVYTREDNPEYGPAVKTVTTVTDHKFLTEAWSVIRMKLYEKNYEFIENDCVPPMRKRPPNVWQE
jgi:hypothetical protein